MLAPIPKIRHYAYGRVTTHNDGYNRPYPKTNRKHFMPSLRVVTGVHTRNMTGNPDRHYADGQTTPGVSLIGGPITEYVIL